MKFKLFIFSLCFCLWLEGVDRHVCVAIMVKNDQATIWRCLKSVEDIADCISICDLGSTDRTREYIEEFLRLTGIPGKIYKRESAADEYAVAVGTAQKTLKIFGFPLFDSYLLMLNPDHALTAESIVQPNALEEDSYLILERSSTLSYHQYKPNLFRASLPAETIAGMKEAAGSGWKTTKKLKTLILFDQAPALNDDEDGEPKVRPEEVQQAKLRQNIELFTQILKDDPDNVQYLLFLAQSQKSLNRYEEAIEGYKARIGKGGDPEEVWFSTYMIGECYEQMGLWIHALHWYLEAFQFNPNRAESLRKIATHYRLLGQNDLAYFFAKHGSQIPKANNDVYFPLPPLCDYHFDEEISVAAYYTRFKEDGYSAANDLLLKKDTPNHIKDQGYRNLLFYVKNINARLTPIHISLPYIQEGKDETYHPMNPSIQKTAEGYKLICRAVNYTQIGAKHFQTSDPQGIFRTRNFLVYMDRQFNPLSQQEIIETIPREHYRSYIVEGLEDCRIFGLSQSSWFTCSTFDTNPNGAIQITLCKIEDAGREGPLRVEKFLPLIGPDPNRHEKNWLPFLKQGALHLIYASDPFTIYKPDLTTGECATVLQYMPEHDFSRFRGSAAPIEFDHGYLMLVHEVVQLPDFSRCYLHRFVFLDRDFTIQQTSKPFTFNHNGIEYCLSMTIDHAEKNLVMPIGIEDREAFILTVSLDEIRALLRPLPTIYAPF